MKWSSSFLICSSFFLKCLFIISVLVSHFHLVPVPAHCFERSIPIPNILGSICLIAASSICNFASLLFAFFSNILSMRSTLSQAFAQIGLSFSFILYIWCALRIFQNMRTFAFCIFISSIISSSLPSPIKVL